MTTHRDLDVDTGLRALLQRSLLTSIWGRRTHRVSRGSSVEGMTEAHALLGERWHRDETGGA